MIHKLRLHPFFQTNGGASGIKRGGKAETTSAPKTSEEILADNIKVVEKVSELGLMHKAALNYGGTPEERTAFYEAVDRVYKRMPEGYGYSFREQKGAFGHTYHMIQIEHVSKHEERVVEKGAYVMKLKTSRYAILASGGSVSRPDDLQSQSALRGYAKAHVFKAAGKIYDPNVKGGVSEEYKPL